jgi:hypothetical protein
MQATQTIDTNRFQELLLIELPNLLRQRPEFRHKVQEIILEAVPSSKDDNQKLLQEIKALREDSNRRFEASERRFEAMDRRFEEQAAEARAHREEVNRRFEEVNQRFEATDRRIDEGFEEVNRRFEEVNRRFEEVNRRFEEVNQRFEATDRRIDEGFEKVNQRIDQETRTLREEMSEGFKNVQRSIDKLGGRWGIRTESVFRQTIAALLEKSYGAKVEMRWIDGEQFDVVIANGEHILVEITASAGAKVLEALERKKRIYTENVQAPARIILATASIHSHRARLVEEAGFELIEPEEEDE